ncbi:MAG: hypothetical protein RIB98_01405 [Acidimicrobiales bacterium]
MTEESDFEARIRRDLDAIAGAVADVPAETPAPQPDDAHPRHAPLLAAVAAGLVLLAGLLWVANDGDTDSSPADVAGSTSTSVAPTSTTTPSSSTTVPAAEAAPPSETGSYRLWLSTEAVSTDGSDVIFVVLGPSDVSEVLEWDSAVLVDRWNGEDWQPVAEGGSCQDFWHCWGDLGERGASLVEYRERRQFLPSGVGYAEYIHLDGLDEGWHRLRQTIDGELATGVFRVLEPAVMPAVASLAPVGEDALFVEPVLASTAGAVLTVKPAIAAPENDLGEVASTTRLDQWDGEEWVELLTFDTPRLTLEIQLPPLPPGPYRVVRGRTPGSDLIGNLWVIDGGPNPVACHVLPSLDALLTNADDFDGPTPPTTELRPSFDVGGFRVQWDSPDTTIAYSYPMGSVIDLVGERYFQDGLLLLRPLGDAVEVWVELPGCGDPGTVTAGFLVSGGSEQQNVALAARLGRSLAQRWNVDGGTRIWEQCPDGESVISTPRNGVILDVWMYCREVGDTDSRLVPVATNIISESVIESAIQRGLGGGWNGLESAIPLELQWALSEIAIIDGVLTIDWDWDFAADPIDDLTTSNVSGRIIDQIAANAFQFEEIDAVDLGDLPLDLGGDSVYTREQWEQAQAEN